MLQEAQIDFGHVNQFAQVGQPVCLQGKNQRPGVVVGAVAVVAVGNRKSRVLKNPDIVCHRADVVEFQLRYRGNQRGRSASLGERRLSVDDRMIAYVAEHVQVGPGDLAPNRAASELVGLLAHRLALWFVVQQPANLFGNRCGIGERNEAAPIVRQHLPGVRVRCRHHRAAGAQGVGERAGNDLPLGQRGSHVNIGRTEKPAQFLQRYEAILKQHVIEHAQLIGKTLKFVPVFFPSCLLDVRVRFTEHDIDQVGMLADQLWQRPNCVFNTLARREQAERQHHLAALDAELVLVDSRVDKRDIRNAVRDHLDLFRTDPIGFLKDLDGPMCHDDDPVRQVDQLDRGLENLIRGVAQDRMHGRNDRHGHVVQHGQKMRAGNAAEDAVFMLDQ